MGPIVSRLAGGLGNQMFQYAAGRVLALKHNSPLFLDPAPLHVPGVHTRRAYGLGCFNIKASLLDSPGRWPSPTGAGWAIVQETGPRYMPSMLNSGPNSLLDGYWQSERYIGSIRPILRRDFTLRKPVSRNTQEWAERILSPRPRRQSVMLHVRRGDYVSSPSAAVHHGTCDLSYYRAAMEKLQERHGDLDIFAFSDDPDWVKDNLKGVAPLHLVSHQHKEARPDHEELWLMQKCNHYIIANSSFSWWAAWLGEAAQSTVVCPARWLLNPDYDTRDIAPARWVRL